MKEYAVPFNGGKSLEKIASNVKQGSIVVDVSDHAGYETFTTDNFIVEAVSGYNVGNGGYRWGVGKSYNPQTGIVTISGLYGATSTTDGGGLIVSLWLIT